MEEKDPSKTPLEKSAGYFLFFYLFLKSSSPGAWFESQLSLEGQSIFGMAISSESASCDSSG